MSDLFIYICRCFLFSDKLPDGFSETLEREEIKSRPGFDTQLHEATPAVTVNHSSNQGQKEVISILYIIQYLFSKSVINPF